MFVLAMVQLGLDNFGWPCRALNFKYVSEYKELTSRIASLPNQPELTRAQRCRQIKPIMFKYSLQILKKLRTLSNFKHLPNISLKQVSALHTRGITRV